MTKRKGLTLIEVILSIMLLGITSISILPMSIHAVKFSKWNNIRQNAMSMAYTQVEWLKTLDYSTELELKGRYLSSGKEGIVVDNLFMNDKNTDPKIVDGIEYRFLTNIYWEPGVSSTGETVANALRKVDVTVRAKDLFSGKEKEYPVLGTLIAFEGERRPDSTTPFKVKAFTGHDFTELTKDVKIEIYNESGTTLRQWGRTDEKGEAVFVGLLDERYQVKAKEWRRGEMISRPTGIKGIYSNLEWISYDLVEINKINEPYKEHNVFVDYPAYIRLQDISEIMLLNSELNLEPKYTPVEGTNINLSLKTNLKNLETLKIWRSWEYGYSILYNGTKYKFIEDETRRVWDGNFEYYNDKPTIKNLTLGYVLEDEYNTENIYKDTGNNKIDIDIVFPESIDPASVESKNGEPPKINFSLYVDNTEISFEVVMVQNVGSNKDKTKFKVHLTTNFSGLNGRNIRFVLNEPIIDKNGIGMINDMNFITLKHFQNKS